MDFHEDTGVPARGKDFLDFLSEFEALNFLHTFALDDANLTCFRSILARDGDMGIFCLNDLEVLQELALELAQRRLLVRPFSEAKSDGTGQASKERPSSSDTSSSQAKEPTPKPETTCRVQSLTIACGHRKGSFKDIPVFEVVPAVAGDKITLTAAIENPCGKHPEWEIRGVLTSTKKGRQTDFRALAWLAHAIWLYKIIPQTYDVELRGCKEGPLTTQVRAYPSDKISREWTLAKEFALKKRINEYLKKILGMYFKEPPELKLCEGKISISTGWKEYTDHRAYYEYDIAIALNPLIGGKIRLPFGPLAVIPSWIKRYGDAYFYVEFSGVISVNAHYLRKNPDKSGAQCDLSGKVQGEVGGELFIIDKKVFLFNVNGNSSIKAAATSLVDDHGWGMELGIEWEGISCEVTIVGLWGCLKYKKSEKIVDGCAIMEKKPVYLSDMLGK